MKEDNNRTSDFHWPDIEHILDVYMQWYKLVVLTILAVGAALLVTYAYVTTASFRFFTLCMKALCKSVGCACNLFQCMIRKIVRHGISCLYSTKHAKATEKLL